MFHQQYVQLWASLRTAVEVDGCVASCVGCVIEAEMSDLVFKLFERVLQGDDAVEQRAL